MTTTFPSTPRLLPILLAAFLVFCLHLRLPAQDQPDKVEVLAPITLATQPMPGQAFDVMQYAPDAMGGSSSFKHITFVSAKVGKIKNAKLEVHLNAVRITASTLTVQGPKAAKRLRRHLVKLYGNPAILTVSEGREVLTWKPTATSKVSSSSDAADTFCTVTLELP